MPQLAQCHEPGLLLVCTRPKSPAYLHEFHDWYNTEHGPARLKLDFFKNGYRYRCKEDPSMWMAIYDIQRVSAVTEPTYTNLRKHRSLREQHVLQKKVDVLERKTYRHLSTRGCISGPTSVITCVSFVVKREDLEEVNRWYEEQHIEDLSHIPGWRRSRRFQIVDGNVHSESVELLAIHDFDENNGLGGAEHQRARDRPWRERIVQLAQYRVNREFHLHHEFRAEDYQNPPEAAIRLSLHTQGGIATRRASLVSGYEYGEKPVMNEALSWTLSSQVH